MDELILKARELLEKAQRVVTLTGAGISAESGVPTFRGKDGLWKSFRAEELATPQAFARDPRTVWEWYDWRRSLLKNLQPNQAHFALVELEARLPDFVLITQNVDGLHELAGSENLIELHGNIWRVKCQSCEGVFYNDDVPISILPMCEECGGLLRPDVVWFGEPLDEEMLEKATALLSSAEVTMVVGTSGLVQPAASMAMLAKSRGSKVIEINPEPTPNSQIADIFLKGKAGEILPRLVSEADKDQ